jgi:hypothetical protein
LQNASVMEEKLLLGAGMLDMGGLWMMTPFWTNDRLISTKSPVSVPSEVMN